MPMRPTKQLVGGGAGCSQLDTAAFHEQETVELRARARVGWVGRCRGATHTLDQLVGAGWRFAGLIHLDLKGGTLTL